MPSGDNSANGHKDNVDIQEQNLNSSSSYNLEASSVPKHAKAKDNLSHLEDREMMELYSQKRDQEKEICISRNKLLMPVSENHRCWMRNMLSRGNFQSYGWL